VKSLVPIAFVAAAVGLVHAGAPALAWTALVFGFALGAFAIPK
jgi:hypothetical protein